MRQTWKGMFLGAVTGALIGLLLEITERGARGARGAANTLRERAPEAAGSARDMAERAADVVREKAPEIAADAKRIASETSTKVSDKAKDKLNEARDSDLFDKDLKESLRR